MNVFQLARMRPIALLALWHQMHPDAHDRDGRAARVSKLTTDALAAAILASK